MIISICLDTFKSFAFFYMLIARSNNMVVFKSIFLKMLVGCEVGRFGVNCTLCRGCQTCDIVSGECGT